MVFYNVPPYQERHSTVQFMYEYINRPVPHSNIHIYHTSIAGIIIYIKLIDIRLGIYAGLYFVKKHILKNKNRNINLSKRFVSNCLENFYN
jgi:hypothetical protein